MRLASPIGLRSFQTYQVNLVDRVFKLVPTIRDYFRCWLKERLKTEFILRPRQSARYGLTWRDICNRIDTLKSGPDGLSRFVDQIDSSYLKVAELFPNVGGRILQQAMKDYPFRLEASTAVTPNGAPELSIVIPFAGTDRLRQLQAVLHSIYGQDEARVEVILIQDVAESGQKLDLASNVRAIYLDEPPGISFNKSRLFNLGVKEASAPYILLHDADILVPRNYASTCIKLFRQGWDAFCPIRFLFYLSETQTQDVINSAVALTRLTSIPEIRQNFAGGSVAITRVAFEQINGFDEQFKGWGGEDVDFLRRARVSKFLLGSLTPAIHLWHTQATGKGQTHPNLKLAMEKKLKAN